MYSNATVVVMIYLSIKQKRMRSTHESEGLKVKVPEQVGLRVSENPEKKSVHAC